MRPEIAPEILDILNNIFTSLRNIALSVEEIRKDLNEIKIDCVKNQSACRIVHDEVKDHLREVSLKKKMNGKCIKPGMIINKLL